MKRILIVIFSIISLPAFSEPDKFQYIYINDTSQVQDEIEQDNALKGYAEFMEDSQAIYLKDDNDEFVLNLKVPQKITSQKLNVTPQTPKKIPTYSKFGAEEYQVIPQSKKAVVKKGGLSFGTTYDQDIDYSEFEQTAAFFTRYKIGKFALNTAYERTIGSTYNNYYDSVYLAPELKLNDMFSVREILTNDMTYRRRKTELVLSVNPLAKTNDDRLNLEFGAGQTFDQNNNMIRSKIRFSTNFKL